MKNKFKIFLAGLLCVAMVLPATAVTFAADDLYIEIAPTDLGPWGPGRVPGGGVIGGGGVGGSCCESFIPLILTLDN